MITSIFAFLEFKWDSLMIQKHCVLLIFPIGFLRRSYTADRWSNEVGIDQGGVLENLPCDLIPRGATLRDVSSLCIYICIHFMRSIQLSLSLYISVSRFHCAPTIFAGYYCPLIPPTSSSHGFAARSVLSFQKMPGNSPWLRVSHGRGRSVETNSEDRGARLATAHQRKRRVLSPTHRWTKELTQGSGQPHASIIALVHHCIPMDGRCERLEQTWSECVAMIRSWNYYLMGIGCDCLSSRLYNLA
jgi:hypothetical protein